MKLLSGLARLIRARRRARRRHEVDLGDMGATSALDATFAALDDATLAPAESRRDREADPDAGHRGTRPARW